MQPVDLYDSATFERAMPHEYFAWLRDHEPLHWQPPREIRANVPEVMRVEQRGYWAVTRHADVVEVSLDQQRFSSERGTVLNTDIGEERMAQLRLWMINQDAPRHTKLRKLVNKGFTKRVIDKMETHIRELCREIVDGVALKGECDFVASVASELPLLVIAELVGCPLEDRAKLFEWSNQMIGFEDPEFANEAGAYPSANRDAAVFEDPDRFDIARDPNPHLAFGWGPHFCLGASLARGEIRGIFAELLSRLPDIEVSGPVRRLRSSTVNSIKSMPVRFTPEG